MHYDLEDCGPRRTFRRARWSVVAAFADAAALNWSARY
jgi:hypothetical protein